MSHHHLSAESPPVTPLLHNAMLVKILSFGAPNFARLRTLATVTSLWQKWAVHQQPVAAATKHALNAQRLPSATSNNNNNNNNTTTRLGRLQQHVLDVIVERSILRDSTAALEAMLSFVHVNDITILSRPLLVVACGLGKRRIVEWCLAQQDVDIHASSSKTLTGLVETRERDDEAKTAALKHKKKSTSGATVSSPRWAPSSPNATNEPISSSSAVAADSASVAVEMREQNPLDGHEYWRRVDSSAFENDDDGANINNNSGAAIVVTVPPTHATERLPLDVIPESGGPLDRALTRSVKLGQRNAAVLVTPLQAALFNSQFEVADLLRSRGAFLGSRQKQGEGEGGEKTIQDAQHNNSGNNEQQPEESPASRLAFYCWRYARPGSQFAAYFIFLVLLVLTVPGCALVPLAVEQCCHPERCQHNKYESYLYASFAACIIGSVLGIVLSRLTHERQQEDGGGDGEGEEEDAAANLRRRRSMLCPMDFCINAVVVLFVMFWLCGVIGLSISVGVSGSRIGANCSDTDTNEVSALPPNLFIIVVSELSVFAFVLVSLLVQLCVLEHGAVFPFRC